MGDHMQLNEEQRNVIESNDPFLFLLAGAGSGKTRVIVEKIKMLILDGVDPNEILAITFTKKSAGEMKERIKNENVNVHTFHQFCYLKIKEITEKDIFIVDENELKFSKEELLSISKYKNSLYRTKKPKSYTSYQTYLNQKGYKDFDDLLLDFLHLFKKKKEMIRYNYLFVDEFQDTNFLQYEILKLLIHSKTYLLAVGDPDQSIYQFRGASERIIDQFIKDYQAKKMILSMNYRSTSVVLSHANELIKHNERKHKKRLFSYHEIPGESYLLTFENQDEEALYITELIKTSSQKEITILYREHVRSYELKQKLYEHQIDFQSKDDEYSYPIKCMTIHQAKGLEFEYVIILGLEEGTLPKHKLMTKKESDEERRLMFVAITRAKSKLILSYSKRNHENRYQKPSRFLREMKIKPMKMKTQNNLKL